MLLELFLLLIFCKLFAYFTCGKCKSKRRMDGKTIIITGANSGLGKESARDLARRGAKVIMACINIESANKVRDEIVQEFGNKNVIVKKIDVSSMASVREFAKDILATEDRLDVLMHNAGLFMGNYNEKSVDGIEMTMATHHFGPFLLTHLLLDLLKKSGPSRIVIVSSLVALLSFENFESLNFDSLHRGHNSYNYIISKHANILFTTELSRRLKGHNVTVNCLHPGAVSTNIFVGLPLLPFLFTFLAKPIFYKTPKQGAQTQIYLAVDEHVENVTGKYFCDCIGFKISTSQREIKNAKALWKKTEEILNLSPEERIIY